MTHPSVEGVSEDSINSEERQEKFARLRDGFDSPAEQDAEAVQAIDEVEVETAGEAEPSVVFEDVPPIATVRLEFPLALAGGSVVTSLSIWPPLFSDVQALTDGVTTEIMLHAEMMRVPVALLRSLRWSDAERVMSIARVIAPELRTS